MFSFLALHERIHTRIHAYLYIHAVRIHVHVHVHSYTYIYAITHTFTHTYIHGDQPHTSTHTLTHTYTQLHIHLHLCDQPWIQTLPHTMEICSVGHFCFAVACEGLAVVSSWISPESAQKSVPPIGSVYLNIIICQRHILVERATSTGFLVERGLVF